MATLLAGLRLSIVDDAAHGAAADTAGDWRGDLRLFLLAWAAGLLFFLIVIA